MNIGHEQRISQLLYPRRDICDYQLSLDLALAEQLEHQGVTIASRRTHSMKLHLSKEGERPTSLRRRLAWVRGTKIADCRWRYPLITLLHRAVFCPFVANQSIRAKVDQSRRASATEKELCNFCRLN